MKLDVSGAIYIIHSSDITSKSWLHITTYFNMQVAYKEGCALDRSYIED